MSDSRMLRSIDFIDKKLGYFTRNTILSLIVIGCIALSLRLYYFPYNIPLTLDALGYFSYAMDTSVLGHLPTDYKFPNNGWPMLLSIFFSIFHSTNFLDYMMLQRLLTVLISVLTIIPVYLLCKRFFDKPYALVGSSLFAFEPRIIQSSASGITEPLYIILVTIALFLFLSTNRKITYASFGITALCALVRYEGMLLFIVLSIMFFVRYRKEKKIIAKYFTATAIFVLLLLPIAYIRIQTTGSDGLTHNIVSAASYGFSATSNENNRELALFLYVIAGLENLIKYLGWVMIPFFVFFVPPGALLILKNRSHNSITIVLSIVILVIPAFYAYSREIQETRYLYVLYPLFCILSIFTVKIFSDKFRNVTVILILLILGILASSLIFLELKKVDLEHEKEAFSIAQHVSDITTVINNYYPESKYVRVTGMINQKFPLLTSSVSMGPKIIRTEGFDSLEEFIKLNRNNGLTHLVLDGASNRPHFLNDVFYNEGKYPYLMKVFDSADHGYKYHAKIYKIDYHKFNSTTID